MLLKWVLCMSGLRPVRSLPLHPKLFNLSLLIDLFAGKLSIVFL